MCPVGNFEEGVPVDSESGSATGLVLDVRGLSYSVGGRQLLDGLDLQVDSGESVVVTGPSGSGKSTLLSCVLGLVRPDTGTVSVAGAEMTRLKGRALARHRRRTIGMVFQFGELLPELSPADNVALAALLSGVPRHQAYRTADELLTELGVPSVDGADRLSGGERQRTAVARALVNAPGLLLADEPTGALDETTRDKVADLLFAQPRARGCGLLVVTHDMRIAERADRVLRVRDGALVPCPAVGGAR
ncbi:ABC transporter ATP-binding protein [Kitasatospora sp. NPDC059827]|uniref:ABC transporter ATP-binding protein n=1 Tax=Kitasatospora sp. NPDC059827 TaxID=3346964 RepID=UPI0036638E15